MDYGLASLERRLKLTAPEGYGPGYEQLQQAISHLRQVNASKLRSTLLLPLKTEKDSSKGYQEQDPILEVEKEFLHLLRESQKTLYNQDSSSFKLATALGDLNRVSGKLSDGLLLNSEKRRISLFERDNELESRIGTSYPLVNLVQLEGEFNNNPTLTLTLTALAKGSRYLLYALDHRRESPLYVPLEV